MSATHSNRPHATATEPQVPQPGAHPGADLIALRAGHMARAARGVDARTTHRMRWRVRG